MIISDLEYLEAISEFSNIVGGSCSIEYNLVNGVPNVSSQGAPLQITQNSDGSTTYRCQDATSLSSVTTGQSGVVVNASAIVS